MREWHMEFDDVFKSDPLKPLMILEGNEWKRGTKDENGMLKKDEAFGDQKGKALEEQK